MAVTCLLFASKVEEQMRNPIDIFIAFHRLFCKEDQVKAVFGAPKTPVIYKIDFNL